MTTAIQNTQVDSINYLFGSNGNVEFHDQKLTIHYSVIIDSSRCGLASAVGELRSVAWRLEDAADKIEGRLTLRTGNESHGMILSRLGAGAACERIEAACETVDGVFAAVEEDFGIDFSFGIDRDCDGSTASIVAVLRDVAGDLLGVAERLIAGLDG